MVEDALAVPTDLLEASPVIEGSSSQIGRLGAEPKTIGHLRRRDLKQYLPKSSPLRIGSDEKLIEAVLVQSQRKKPKQPPTLLNDGDVPPSHHLARNTLNHFSPCHCRALEANGFPAFKPHVRKRSFIAWVIGSNVHR